MTVLTLIHRELLRFWRQKSRVIGAFGTPVIFWFILGSGVGQSLSLQKDSNYLTYFFPGTLALMLLFTSIFSAISLILDRQEGFLQSVLVAPVSRFQIVSGKILGGAFFAVLQGVVFLMLAPWVGFSLMIAQWIWLGLGMFILGVGLSALGFFFAWKIDSIQGYHAIMNLLLFPMWLLSGALFPMQNAPTWLKTIMAINPMTYGIDFFRKVLWAENNFLVSFVVLSMCSLIFYGLALWTVRKTA